MAQKFGPSDESQKRRRDMQRSRSTIGVLCIVLVSAFCLTQNSWAADSMPGVMKVETGQNSAPGDADNSYKHGCIVICSYSKGQCGWARTKGNRHSVRVLCQAARALACDVCTEKGKTPVTKRVIHKTW
jgi:hypothetical protein